MNEEIMEQHPGPKPINIYHYGIFQNWKHVLYPISIQKRRQRQRRQPPPPPQQQQQHSVTSNAHIDRFTVNQSRKAT
jgi:hypothetical protein